MERETGIEPVTSSLGSWRSTAELLPLNFVRLPFQRIRDNGSKERIPAFAAEKILTTGKQKFTAEFLLVATIKSLSFKLLIAAWMGLGSGSY
jgi:hypothetical protein